MSLWSIFIRLSRCVAISLIFVSSGFAAPAAEDLTAQLQKGLIEEEANHNLVEAIKAYQSVASQFDKDRKLAATAIFRLAECFRKQGNTNEAAKYYDRIVREFSDQTNLVAAVRQVDRNATKRNSALPGGLSLEDRLMAADTQFSTASTQLSELKKLSTEKRRISVQKILTSTVYDSLLTRLLELERNIASSNPELSPDHPKRKAMDIELKVLETQIDDQVEAAMAALATEQSASGSVFRNLRMQQRSAEGGETSEVAQNDLSEEEGKEFQKIKAMLKNSPDLINKLIGGAGGRFTQFTSAAYNGYTTIVEFLCGQKGLIDKSDLNMALGIAAGYGHRGVAEIVLRHGADINSFAYDGWSPLFNAVQGGHRTIVELLLEKGADVNRSNAKKETALSIAAVSGRTHLAELLIARGADVNAQAATNKWTPLHYAAERQSIGFVNLLLTNKANLHLENSQGETPFYRAFLSGRVELAKTLLEAGSKPEQSLKWPLIVHTIVNLQTPVPFLEMVLPRKPDLEAKDKLNSTPLQSAILIGKIDAALFLLDAGANPNSKMESANQNLKLPGQGQNVQNTTEHDSPLHWAVSLQNSNLLTKLLEKGGDPNVGNKSSYTPLMLAASALNGDAVKVLLEYKADPNIALPDSQTALDLIRRQGGPAIAYNREQTGMLRLAPGGVLPVAISQVASSGSSSREAIEKLLIAAGAKEVRRQASISVMRKGLQSSPPIFQKDAANLNRFSLMELVAEVYASQTSQGFSWPKLSAIKIHHFEKSGPGSSQTFDLEKTLENRDCTKDFFLQWGDVVEIPEEDHSIAESWGGFPPNIRNQLEKCMERNIQVIVKGNATPIHCSPRPSFILGGAPIYSGINNTAVRTNLLSGFWLRSIIHASNLLRTSSDLKNIRVYRAPSERQARVNEMNNEILKKANAAGLIPAKLNDAVKEGRYLKITVDISQDSKEKDLWIRDGDIIEIADKE